MRVAMAESSDIYRDGRVQKEAFSLVKAGFDVTVLGFQSNNRARSTLPFKLIALPIVSRKHRAFRNVTILINVILLNIRILFMHADVYHAHNTMFLLGMLLASRIHSGVFIYDSHEVQHEAGRIQAWLEKVFIHKVDAVINVSEGRADYQAKQHGLQRQQICIIHNYPELQDNSELRRPPQSGTHFTRLVFSGGFHLGDNRLDEFVKLLVGIPNVQFDLIAFGYGNSEAILRRVIDEFGLNDVVQFRPLVPHNQLLTVLQSYDLAVDMLVNPEQYISKRYPAINKTYEYFAAGLPIICSDMDAFVDNIQNQGAGIAINLLRTDEARKCLVRLLSNPQRIQTMKGKVRRLSVEKYNWATEERRLISLYEKLRVKKSGRLY